MTISKPKKERANKYEDKVSFNGTFDELLNLAVNNDTQKAKVKKAPKKTKI